MAHLERDKDKLVARVRRIGGQLASIERALAADADCGAILQQVAAVRGAAHSLTLHLLDAHLREHVAPSLGKKKQDELEPVLALLRRYL